MDNQLTIFNSDEFGEIRTVVKKDVVWFVAKDIVNILELTNITETLKRVDEEDLSSVKLNSGNQLREMKIVNESGLYQIIFMSKKQQAKEFKRWVTSEVLPSIRKDGAYMTDKTIEKALNEPDFLIELATRLKQEKEKRMQLEKEKQQMLPKVDYYERVLDSSSDFTITDLSKENEMTARQLNIILTQEGVQFKQGRRYFLKKDFQDRGLTHTRTYDYENSKGEITTKHSLVWTEKGREFINELLEDI